MANITDRKVYRVAGNARRVIVPVLAVLLILGFWTFLNMAEAHDYDWPWRAGGSALILAWWWSEHRGIGSRVTRALSERAIRSDAAWAVISGILRVARRVRAAFGRLLDTPPFRLLARLALPLGILLTAAMAYRLVAIPALLARGAGDSGGDLALLALDWLLFGLGYGLVGLAAPLAALLLLLRRRRLSLGVAMALHAFGLFGVSVAFMRAILGAVLGASARDAAVEWMTHPLFAQPENVVLVIVLLACEFLAGVVALYLLWRPRVRRHYDEQAGSAGTAAD